MSVRELCHGLAQTGMEIHLWTTLRGYNPAIDQPADQDLLRAGVRLRYFPVHPWKPLGRQYAYSPTLGSALRNEMPPVDLIHLHGLWQYPARVASCVCRQKKIPYIVSPCGSLGPYSLRSHRMFKWLYGYGIERWNLASAAALHFTSSMEQQSAWLFGLHRPSIVIPRSIGIAPAEVPPRGTFRSRHPEVGDRQILLFLGRLHPVKRLDIVVGAFSIVAQRNRRIHLLIAGPDDGEGQGARDSLRRSHLLDHVTFIDVLAGADKWAALHDSTLLLLPSDHENFGRAALEAMAVGTPVLVSPHVALAHTIAHAGAGMVVEGPPIRWAQTIECLLDNPSLVRTLGEAGRQLVETEFSPERTAKAMRSIYDRFIP